MGKLGKSLLIRLEDEDVGRLEALTKRIPIATRAAIARLAMRLGMAALEADPGKALIGSESLKLNRKK